MQRYKELKGAEDGTKVQRMRKVQMGVKVGAKGKKGVKTDTEVQRVKSV